MVRVELSFKDEREEVVAARLMLVFWFLVSDELVPVLCRRDCRLDVKEEGLLSREGLDIDGVKFETWGFVRANVCL